MRHCELVLGGGIVLDLGCKLAIVLQRFHEQLLPQSLGAGGFLKLIYKLDPKSINHAPHLREMLSGLLKVQLCLGECMTGALLRATDD